MVGAEWKRTVAIADLASRYEPLVLALGRAAVPADRIEPLLAESVALRCIQCGASTSGASLVALGLNNADAISGSTEWQRLSQKHCVTESCPCCFCDLRFAPVAGLDWEAIWAAAESIGEEERVRAAEAERPPGLQSLGRDKLMLIGAVLLLALACSGFLYNRLRTPQWAKPIPVYRGDTNTPVPTLLNTHGETR